MDVEIILLSGPIKLNDISLSDSRAWLYGEYYDNYSHTCYTYEHEKQKVREFMSEISKLVIRDINERELMFEIPVTSQIPSDLKFRISPETVFHTKSLCLSFKETISDYYYRSTDEEMTLEDVQIEFGQNVLEAQR